MGVGVGVVVGCWSWLSWFSWLLWLLWLSWWLWTSPKIVVIAQTFILFIDTARSFDGCVPNCTRVVLGVEVSVVFFQRGGDLERDTGHKPLTSRARGVFP